MLTLCYIKRLLYQTAWILPVLIWDKSFAMNLNFSVSLIAKIHRYYMFPGVVILYGDNSNGFMAQSNVSALIKRLSARYIPSQAVRYSDLDEASNYYLALRKGSLFVTPLTSEENFENLSEATSRTDMSRHSWLTIFAEYINQQVFDMCQRPSGNPFNLIFSSRMIVRCFKDDTLRKWFSIYGNQTETLELDKCDPGWDLTHTRNYFDSRYNLSGKIIRIATNSRKTSQMNAKMAGFFEAVLHELEASMNFEVKLVKTDDGFGKWDSKNRRWSGLMGSLIEQQIDMAVAPISISEARLNFIDFTRPLLRSPVRIYVRQPNGTRVQWSAYFRIFTIPVWIYIGLALILATLVTTLIRIRLNDLDYFWISLDHILENFIDMWGIYCQQGVPEFPVATSLRLAYFTMLLMALLIYAIYSASITSYLTVLTPTLPFSDTKGFAQDRSYKLIVLQNSNDQNLIMSSKDPVLSVLQPLMKNFEDLPLNPFEGFQQVCNERVGFYTSEADHKGVSARIPCDLTFIETGQFECLAMAFPRNSPYKISINYNLRRLEDVGILNRLKNRYFREYSINFETGHPEISLSGVAPLLTIFVSGTAISILSLNWETRTLESAARKISDNLCARIGLDLTPPKAKLIHFNNERIPPSKISIDVIVMSITIDGQQVCSCASAKILGIWFDY
ncbi:hypothetical protein QAD02_014795 [Eretmocerus hayati]|uniref:Uncharacterized protein n=1 Tax=Eretmocerus hayati TaxID=131215 RepID=A0ACC2P7E4_9HYME|nr:hypothetical protein QAD02_014795 [Eretmocerus hayati]